MSTTTFVGLARERDQRARQAPARPRTQRTWHDLTAADQRRIRRSGVIGVVAGFIPFIAVLWDFSLRPLRAAGAHGFGSDFYETQARALFDGRLSVPTYSLGIEGFVIDGNTYMYFPPFPSILRMPILAFTDRLDGRLTAPSMLLAWLVLAAAIVALVWSVRFLLRGTATVSRGEAVVSAIVVAACTGGSIIVFLASLPWVYHEAYLWASAFAVVTLACVVNLARRPTARLVTLTGAATLGVILTRTTSGWAMAFTVMAAAVGLWIHARRADDRDVASRARRLAPFVLAAGLLPLLVAIAINWAKFRHPYMFPLEHQVWTSDNQRRRLALRMNDGSLTGPGMFPSTLINYFRPDGIRLAPYFPFVTLPAEPARAYAGAFLDQVYRTGSVPAFSPLLFGLAIWGMVATARARVAQCVRGLVIPHLGAIAVAGGVMFYGYIAFRYTAEFYPALAFGSAVAAVDLGRRATRWRRRAKLPLVAALAVLAAFGTAANSAAGLAAARETYRGQPLIDYLGLQHRLGAVTGRPEVVQTLFGTTEAPADRLLIVGECSALYLATGNPYEPWVTVEVREIAVTIEASADGYNDGVLGLYVFTGLRTRHVSLESDGDRQRIRTRVAEGDFHYSGDWVGLAPGDRIDLVVHVDTRYDRFWILFRNHRPADPAATTPIAEDDLPADRVTASETDGNRPQTVTTAHFDLPPSLDQALVGVALQPSYGPPLELCNRLLDEVDEEDRL